MHNRRPVIISLSALLVALSAACSVDATAAVRIGNSFVATPVAKFKEPWAMTFLPDGRLLVSEKKGALKLLDVDTRRVGDITGVPTVAWTPVISPAGFIIYSGKMFPDWIGDGFIGGLSSESLVRVEFGAGTAREAQRFGMGERIREVEQGPDGAIWLLEDGKSSSAGRLLKPTP